MKPMRGAMRLAGTAEPGKNGLKAGLRAPSADHFVGESLEVFGFGDGWNHGVVGRLGVAGHAAQDPPRG